MDVGGTGIKGTFADEKGKVNGKILQFASKSKESKTEIVNNFCRIIKEIWNSINDGNKALTGIAMACPGPFDYANGVFLIKELGKYNAVYNVSLPDEILKAKAENDMYFLDESCSFRFINDVEAYARGAYTRQEIKKYSRILFLCIGTGCGSAFMADGKICTDTFQGVPENGWVYAVPFRESVIDDYISARGIESLGKKHLKKQLTPHEISKMYDEGIPSAIAVYKEFGYNLKEAIEPIVLNFNADAVVLGGKISRSAHMFIKPLEEGCKGIKILIEPDTSKMTCIGLESLF